MRISKRNWALAFLTLPCFLAAGCFFNGPSGVASKYTQRLGDRAQLDFHQSPQLVHTIEISRSAPEAWSARFTRGAPLVSGEDPSWQIDSTLNPQGHPYKDRIAYQGRIDHLLETLATITILGPAPRGSLASLGLQPPLASLRWQTEDGMWELALGEVQSDGSQVCASPAWREPQMCRGAALEMMAQVEKLDQMRLPTWATFRAEDVEEIDVKRPGKAEFRAKRQGGAWVSQGHKVALGEPLERLTHSRIREFIEQEDQLASAKKGNPQDTTEIVFHHASGDSTRLKLSSRGGRWIGTNSARPDGTFELHPETAKLIDKISRDLGQH